MKIVLTGGGSGGHITPLLAVAHELKQLRPNNVTLVYIGQRRDSLGDVPAQHPDIDEVHTVRAGKFRRYHSEGLTQLIDITTMAKNVRDAGRVVRGLIESRRLLKRIKPDVILIKGGFVGVPVGLAAAGLHIPFVTHDSDAIPGLANRIIARWTTFHAVALPKDVYPYPQDTTVTVGVPVQQEYQLVKAAELQHFRKELDVPVASKVILVTGGGLGAQRLNQAAAAAMPTLLQRYPDLVVLHAAGRQNEAQLRNLYRTVLQPADQARVVVKGFIRDLYRYSGAADLIVSRAGATNLAEFAVQGKACIIVPHPNLTGGHQLKNAQSLAKRGAVIVVPETELTPPSDCLTVLCAQLLDHQDRRQQLADRLRALAHPDAAHELAQLILRVAEKGR